MMLTMILLERGMTNDEITAKARFGIEPRVYRGVTFVFRTEPGYDGAVRTRLGPSPDDRIWSVAR